MHDVLCDMAHWLARKHGNEILVKEHTGLIKSQEIGKWKEAVRVSLFGGSTRFLIETPVVSMSQNHFCYGFHTDDITSSWPTFPQIFIKGEFIGGSDIILNMHQNGELKEKLKDIAASVEKSE
ncbi:hypothetical protein LWI29_009231 [Acer saccharum]|uniref:Glutaredoxin n=1 Tax=Acer saccharum TaxID=4024 RepID=A0AA39VYV7_ACESA|nr:hypothetical protein LWI29_009231 [Acer saccharum]